MNETSLLFVTLFNKFYVYFCSFRSYTYILTFSAEYETVH